MIHDTDPYPQVALDFMNQDHAEFAALRDRLLEQLKGSSSIEVVTETLDHLLQHTRQHFASEEQVMHDSGFPPYPVHKSEHERVLAEMAARVDRWNRTHDATSLGEWLNKDVGEWFVSHIRTMDFVTAAFVSKHLSVR